MKKIAMFFQKKKGSYECCVLSGYVKCRADNYHCLLQMKVLIGAVFPLACCPIESRRIIRTHLQDKETIAFQQDMCINLLIQIF